MDFARESTTRSNRSTTRSNGAVLRSGVIGQNLLPKWLTMAHSSKAKRLKSLEISRFRVERMTGVEPYRNRFTPRARIGKTLKYKRFQFIGHSFDLYECSSFGTVLVPL